MLGKLGLTKTFYCQECKKKLGLIVNKELFCKGCQAVLCKNCRFYGDPENGVKEPWMCLRCYVNA